MALSLKVELEGWVDDEEAESFKKMLKENKVYGRNKEKGK